MRRQQEVRKEEEDKSIAYAFLPLLLSLYRVRYVIFCLTQWEVLTNLFQYDLDAVSARDARVNLVTPDSSLPLSIRAGEGTAAVVVGILQKSGVWLLISADSVRGVLLRGALEEDFRHRCVSASVLPSKGGRVQKAEQLIALSLSLRHKPWQIPEP